MTVEGLEALAADLLEYENLVSLYIICKDRCLYDSALYIGSTDFDLAVCIEQKHFVKLYFGIFGLGKMGHKKFVSGLYLELAACNVYDCVHNKKLFLKFWLQASALTAALDGLDSLK